jgi:hypothetical protein
VDGKRKRFRIDTGGRRREKPLTAEQIRKAKDFAIELGMPEDQISYSDSQYYTGHEPNFDILLLGTDLYPAEDPKQGTKNANMRVTWKGAISHELVGHREAALKGWTQKNVLFEETQASIRAARFTPGLSDIERITLLRDAISRLPEGIRLRDIRNKLHISER